MEMTNARKNSPGLDNELFDKIIARYVLDPWSKDPINLEILVFKDFIWWYQESIVVHDVGFLRKNILFEYQDVFL
jgi:hypothetical protein